MALPAGTTARGGGLNPFFIREALQRSLTRVTQGREKVSIPSSSGRRCNECSAEARTRVRSVSQSLLHQGGVATAEVLGHVLGVRHRRSQSLLHQGGVATYRLRNTLTQATWSQSLLHQGGVATHSYQAVANRCGLVSIPSSSGRRCNDRRRRLCTSTIDGLNPFFIREALQRSSLPDPMIKCEGSQSLLHQGGVATTMKWKNSLRSFA